LPAEFTESVETRGENAFFAVQESLDFGEIDI